jgi:hypothetical protein
MCSSFNPNTDIDFLNALLVYYEPLSALMMGLFLATEPITELLPQPKPILVKSRQK